MKLPKIKQLAAEIMKVGTSKIWLNPEETATISEAVTKEDIKGLISERQIKKRRDQGQSKGRARILAEKKKKGRKSGKGKRKGTKKTRVNEKESWMKKIRSQRRELRKLKDSNEITASVYREAYNKARGGYFRDKKHINQYVSKEA